MTRVHVMCHVLNTLYMEIQTATPQMAKLMDGWPGITDSTIPVPERPGLDIELKPNVLEANERIKKEMTYIETEFFEKTRFLCTLIHFVEQYISSIGI